MKARYFEKLEGNAVRCTLCPHECRIPDGASGVCGARRNAGGVLEAVRYGELAAECVDPIEKKPLYHFRPGSSIFSVGGHGCNFRCIFCQNWHLVEGIGGTVRVRPEQVVAAAERSGSGALAWTYNEPLINYEFILDASRLARERGLAVVAVTNGFVNPEPLAELLPFLDAANVDIKAFDDDFYRTLCGGRLAPVLEAVKLMARSIHVEVTNLVIPGRNDSPESFRALAEWVASECGRDTPLHFSAYYPAWKATFPPTPLETLVEARDTALEYLDFVFLGNVGPGPWNDTVCPACGNVLIKRTYYSVSLSGLRDGRCASCGAPAPFIRS